MHDESTVPYGYCHCGCGQKTSIPSRTTSSKGWFKGQPVRYVRGHHMRRSEWAIEFQETPGPLPTPCWVWAGGLNGNGYGEIRVQGRKVVAHRVYYEARFGAVPVGLELDHLCRDRACVNPGHLEAVTHAENVRRGALAKLSPDAVAAIRTRVAAGETLRRIATDYGVAHTTIGDAANGTTWHARK